MHERPGQYPAQEAGIAARPPAVGASATPGPLARLIAFIVSAGLAWAIVIAVCAWLLGLVFTRG